MPRSFVISLARSADRLSDFRRREESTGLRSEVFRAVDGRALEVLPPHHPGMSAGAVGCFLSHRELLRTISTAADEWVIVLEDDVLFWPGFRTRLERVLADADRISARFVQLGWLPGSGPPDRLELLRDRLAASAVVRRAAHVLRPEVDVEPRMVVGAPLRGGAHCYAVRPDFAATAVELLDGPRIHRPIDLYFGVFQQLCVEEVTRSRFSLAGQTLIGESTTVPGRPAITYQTDAAGRVVRRKRIPSGGEPGIWAGWDVGDTGDGRSPETPPVHPPARDRVSSSDT